MSVASSQWCCQCPVLGFDDGPLMNKGATVWEAVEGVGKSFDNILGVYYDFKYCFQEQTHLFYIIFISFVIRSDHWCMCDAL